MSQLDENVSRLGYVEPLEHESISHYLGRLRRFKANCLPSAYSLGQAAGIGAVTARWERLYFNPFPTEKELQAIGRIIGLDPSRFREMLPTQQMTLQPRPIRLCGACYAEVPCHRMEWQHKDVIAVCRHHNLRLLQQCPRCKRPFQIPASWKDGKCNRCEMDFTLMTQYQEKIRRTGKNLNP
jgi:hypothetical protein